MADWQYDTVYKYGTPQFLVKGAVRAFYEGTGTLLWYAV